MIGKFASVFFWTVPLITMAISYGDYDEQLRDYYDNLYQRSSVKEQESEGKSSEILKLTMPGVHPTKHDTYLCTAVDLRNKKTYIAGFKPHAEMHTAHHMLLFGCPTPGQNALASEGKYWNCGDMGSGVCRGAGERILYAWGRNAPVLKLPKDVAFEVGGKVGVNYLVLQVHYGKVDNFVANTSLKDYSGVDLQTTRVQPSHLAAIFLLASGGLIPARQKAWHLDTGCGYRSGPVLHPFAFRVHAHSLGSVITGYRIRDGKWTLIGKGDPQRPQAFYPVDKDMEIRSGDSMAARCTYNSMQRDQVTDIGATMNDEMCNFYMMYWYDPKLSDFGGASIEDACQFLDEGQLDLPSDSDVPLPGSGPKMEMKRNLGERFCEPNCDDKSSPSLLEEDQSWQGNKLADGMRRSSKFGQVTAVDTDSEGKVLIFHRASRTWRADSFDEHNIFSATSDPIPEPTVMKLDPKTGTVIDSWGERM
ncbi:peptidylglycine alpha-hydroxylating monooxygenase-like isoform X2 [Stylophora pistillata]|uniref:peptidylglycine alpha-hydroxylating monooxygenase-like isoform X2 n=1 Tax=Stylophora pistillata TaxID=50429 RepID=UPI000C039B44|nr:peptidylglycine alpha-hydroxylating monooxygenase-like isoform X2 [Stylophora pistillata]